ncbi:MAG: transglycosylase SLT domain-containing protein [Pseudomonadota bacterium]
MTRKAMHWGRVSLGVILASWGLVTQAAIPDRAQHERLLERVLFLKAERLISHGKMNVAKRQQLSRIVDRLARYPLLPYIDVQLAGPQATAAWLRGHPHAPFVSDLRVRHLQRLVKQRKFERALAAIPVDTQSSRLKCLRVQALLDAKRYQDARPMLSELWLVGESQSALCDRPFGWWRRTGGLTDALIWARIGLAMENKALGLARHLSRGLSKPQKALVSHWRTVHRRPHKVVQFATKYHKTPEQQQVIAHGFRRWAIRAPEKAEAAWNKLTIRNQIDPAQRQRVESTLGMSFAREHSPAAKKWLFRPVETVHAELAHWRLVVAAKEGDWQQVLNTVDTAEVTERNQLQLRYWRARASEALGRVTEAHPIYAELAQDRSYYGFLAADRLALPYRFNHQRLDVDDKALAELSNHPAIGRAVEFQALGRRVSFRREWNALMEHQDLAVLGRFAEAQGWHALAIATVARGELYDDLELRFPLAYRDAFMRAAKQQDLNPAWLFATARQESAFMAYARSGKGAIGLMQIMPGTGRAISKALREPLRSTRALHDPALNIRFGSYYLRSLADRLFQHRALASAAYNAGPHRVRRWLPQGRSLAADIWIEAVPFRETRSYVKRVLAYQAIYEQQLGRKPTRLIDILKPVPALTETSAALSQSVQG